MRDTLGIEDLEPLSPLIHLQQGWNIISTPITLDANRDSLNEVLFGLDWTVAYTFCGATQQWVLLNGAHILTPCSAVYINMQEEGTGQIVPDSGISAPPSKELHYRWNLISLASLEGMDVDTALISIHEAAGGRTGYVQAVSPALNDESWTFIRGQTVDVPQMQPTEGYWVFLENDETLAGFTTTPV